MNSIIHDSTQKKSSSPSPGGLERALLFIFWTDKNSRTQTRYAVINVSKGQQAMVFIQQMGADYAGFSINHQDLKIALFSHQVRTSESFRNEKEESVCLFFSYPCLLLFVTNCILPPEVQYWGPKRLSLQLPRSAKNRPRLPHQLCGGN